MPPSLNSFLQSYVQEPLPARLGTEQTAKILGFQAHDIAILISGKLLKPLGNPAPNAPKYFATIQILEIARNLEWLDKASKTISKHWKSKNKRKKSANLVPPTV